MLIDMIGVAAVLVSLFALWAAYRTWRLTRQEAEGDAHEALSVGAGRTRFLGLCGMVASSIFIVGTLFLLLVPILESPCAMAFP